ncbi:hypothetical protein AOLI_G00228350 [Acnodon oligacanthus]
MNICQAWHPSSPPQPGAEPVTPLFNDNPFLEMNVAGPSPCQLKAPHTLPEVFAITLLSAVTPATATCPVRVQGSHGSSYVSSRISQLKHMFLIRNHLELSNCPSKGTSSR